MRVYLDAGTCQGHNRCYSLAPDLFDVDDLGQAMLINDRPKTGDAQHRARLAASNCPEFAITIADN